MFATATTPLHEKSLAVQEMQQLFKPMLSNPDFETNVCKRIKAVELIEAARKFSPERLGIEILEISQKIFCDELRKQCGKVGDEVIRIKKLSYSGELTPMSTYDWFQNANICKYYPFGPKRNSTGIRHTQKPDGVWSYEVFYRQHSVHTWLLNVEIDADKKESKGDLQAYCNKMWQAVDFQRVWRPNAHAFTLRTNMSHIYSSKYANDTRKMSVAELEDALARANDNASGQAVVGDLVYQQKQKDHNILELFVDMMQNFTAAHVHFLAVMIRTLCCKGDLYDAMYSNTEYNNKEHIFDMHCFLGCFTIDPLNYISLTAPMAGPDWSPVGTEVKYQREDKAKKLPICTVPSVFGNGTERVPAFQNWKAGVIHHRTNKSVGPGVDVQFMCVQRVNMRNAVRDQLLQWSKETETAHSRQSSGTSSGITNQRLKLNIWDGVWYATDICYFIQNILTRDQEISITNESLQARMRLLGLFWTNTGLPTAWQDWQKPANGTFNNIQKFHYCMRSPSSDGVSNSGIFRMMNNNDSDFFKTGECWVVHSIVDEMQNALLTLWWSNIETNSVNQYQNDKWTVRQDGRIKWHIDDPREINVGNIVDTVKRISNDFIAKVMTRGEFEIDASFERFKIPGRGDDSMVVLSNTLEAQSLRAYCLRGMVSTLPKLDKHLTAYISKFKCPDLYVFLQMVRCNNVLALQELPSCIDKSEATRQHYEKLLAQFPLVVQSEIQHALDVTRDDPALISQIQPVSTFQPKHDGRFRMIERSRKLVETMINLHFLPPASAVTYYDLQSHAADDTVIIPVFDIFTDFAKPLLHAAQGMLQQERLLVYTPYTETNLDEFGGGYSETPELRGWMRAYLQPAPDPDASRNSPPPDKCWPFRMVHKMVKEEDHGSAVRLARSVLRNSAEEQLMLWAFTQRYLKENRLSVTQTQMANTFHKIVRFQYETDYHLFQYNGNGYQCYMRRTHETILQLSDFANTRAIVYKCAAEGYQSTTSNELQGVQSFVTSPVRSDFFLTVKQVQDQKYQFRSWWILANFTEDRVFDGKVWFEHTLENEQKFCEIHWAQDSMCIYMLTNKDRQYYVTIFHGAPKWQEPMINPMTRPCISLPTLNFTYKQLHAVAQGRFLVLQAIPTNPDGNDSNRFHIHVFGRHLKSPQWQQQGNDPETWQEISIQYQWISQSYLNIPSNHARILSSEAMLEGTKDPRIVINILYSTQQSGDATHLCRAVIRWNTQSTTKFLNNCWIAKPHKCKELDNDSYSRNLPTQIYGFPTQNYSMSHDQLIVIVRHRLVNDYRSTVRRAVLVSKSGYAPRIIHQPDRTILRDDGATSELIVGLSGDSIKKLRAARRHDFRGDNGRSWPYFHTYHCTSTVMVRQWGWWIAPQHDKVHQSWNWALCSALEYDSLDENMNDEPNLHYKWQMRRTLQSELPDDMFWDEDPAHVAIELETLAVSSWLALKQSSALSFSDKGGRRHSEYHVREVDIPAREHHNKCEIVGQTLRLKPVPCFLSRVFFHCSLDEEELQDAEMQIRKLQGEEDAGDDQQKPAKQGGEDEGYDQLTSRDLDMLLLRMPTLWDTLCTHAWYMRELAYAVLVCWRTCVSTDSERTDEQIRTKRRRAVCPSYIGKQNEWKKDYNALTAANYRKYDIKLHPLLSRSDGVVCQLCQDGLHGFGLRRGQLEIDKRKNNNDGSLSITTPENALSAIQRRRLNNIMVSIKVRKALANYEYDEGWRHVFEQRKIKVQRFLRAACHWKRYLLVLNMQQRLILQRLRCSSIDLDQHRLASYCNHVIGLQRGRESMYDVINQTRREVEQALLANGYNTVSHEKDEYKYWIKPELKVQRELLEKLFRHLFQSIQANTIVQHILQIFKIQARTSEIDEIWQKFFDAEHQHDYSYLPLCTSDEWEKLYCNRLQIPQLSQ